MTSVVSRAGFKHAAGNLVRLAVLGVCLVTLLLARGNAPVAVLVALVAICLVALYVVDRKSGGIGLWGAYLVGFVLFALLRTVADETEIAVKGQYVVDAERSLLGGTLPSEWLQERLYTPGSNGMLDMLVVGVIFSYYVAPHVVALVLWKRNFAAFRLYCPAVLLTVYAGLLVSLAVPTAPPWLASGYSDAPHMDRVSADVLNWNPETASGGGSNPFAAMPSLHFALTTLIVIALWRRPFLRSLTLLYAAAMAFALVYGAEHYVVDVLAGAATAALAWAAVTRLRLPRRRQESRTIPASAAIAPASPAD